jgi:hypothetical protein
VVCRRRQELGAAAFELHEIKQGLEDAAKLHPTHDGIAVADPIKANLDAPLSAFAKAIEEKDRRRRRTPSSGSSVRRGPPVSNQHFAPRGK